MSQTEKRNIESPDDQRKFQKGQLKVVKLDGVVFGKAVFEAGWKWSECIKPIAGTPSCQVHHNGYVESGRMRIRMDDGTETEVGPGDVFVCPPGHDAWTVGKESCVLFDFSSEIANYAKK